MLTTTYLYSVWLSIKFFGGLKKDLLILWVENMSVYYGFHSPLLPRTSATQTAL